MVLPGVVSDRADPPTLAAFGARSPAYEVEYGDDKWVSLRRRVAGKFDRIGSFFEILPP